MKEQKIERRNFLKYAATATIGASLLSHSQTTQAGRANARLRKALQLGMLPRDLSDADKFKLARKCGARDHTIVVSARAAKKNAIM